MKVPVKLQEYEIKFLKNKGMLMIMPKYPNEEHLNNFGFIYVYVLLYGCFMIDEETSEIFKLTDKDIPKFLIEEFEQIFKLNLLKFV
jgi:hypothetical protein